MRVCPKCNTPYPDAIQQCAKDGTALTTLLEIIEERSAAPARNLSGEVIGNYRIGKRIGAGGMGAVYQGTHLSIGKDFAIKILREDCADNSTLLDRFLQEARSVARISHENVVQITDFGCTSEGRTYLVMERLIGQSLEDLLQREKRLLPARALHIAAQICDALGAAHQLGIIHRDLKPDNVFLIQSRGDPDFVKVLDFGIAKQLEESRDHGLTMTRQLVGTPMYMAPEQGTSVDNRTDIYALGVTLYRMVTGRLPFEGANVMDILYKHISETPKPPIELEASLPLALNNAILTALAKEPAKRFQVYGGLRHRLANAPTVEYLRARAQPRGTRASQRAAPTDDFGRTRRGALARAPRCDKARGDHRRRNVRGARRHDDGCPLEQPARAWTSRGAARGLAPSGAAATRATSDGRAERGHRARSFLSRGARARSLCADRARRQGAPRAHRGERAKGASSGRA